MRSTSVVREKAVLQASVGLAQRAVLGVRCERSAQNEILVCLNLLIEGRMAPHHVTAILHFSDCLGCRAPLESNTVVGDEASGAMPSMTTADGHLGAVGLCFFDPGVEGLQEVQRDRPVLLLGEVVTNSQVGVEGLTIATFPILALAVENQDFFDPEPAQHLEVRGTQTSAAIEGEAGFNDVCTAVWVAVPD